MAKWIPAALLAVCCPWVARAQSVVINEVQVKPPSDALSAQYQSMFNCPNPTFGAEWVELYNPDPCFTMDVSGYLLGARTIATNYGAIMIPAGTTIPPLGFIVLGGPNAPSVDINLTSLCASTSICTDGDSRWYMENGDGWVALYNPTGTPVDAVYWTFSSGETAKLTTDGDFASGPCTPAGSAAGALASASTMGALIRYAGAGPAINQTVYRTTDGGPTWANNGSPTPKACNAVCSSLACVPLDGSPLRFAGVPLRQDNYLYWFDAQQQAASYEVQMAADDGTFATLHQLPAHHSAAGHHSWTHAQPGNGTHRYRILSRDADGALLSTSQVLALHSGPSPEAQVTVAPSPSHGEATLTVSLPIPEHGTWSLVTATGAVVARRQLDPYEMQQHTLELHSLPAGIYLWQFHSAHYFLSGAWMKSE